MEGREWFHTPTGERLEFFFREDTNDRGTIESILTEDEYNLRNLPPLTGWAVDVGAHIGTWGIALAAHHPGITVMGIEALAENALMAQRNVRLNNLEKRVRIIQRAASSTNHAQVIKYGDDGTDFSMRHRFIGGMEGMEKSLSQTVPGIRLTRLLRMIKDDVRIMKIDCEGCEKRWLSSNQLAKINELVGEYHGGWNPATALGATHHVEESPAGDGFGRFHALRRTQV